MRPIDIVRIEIFKVDCPAGFTYPDEKRTKANCRGAAPMPEPNTKALPWPGDARSLMYTPHRQPIVLICRYLRHRSGCHCAVVRQARRIHDYRVVTGACLNQVVSTACQNNEVIARSRINVAAG